MPQEWIGYLRKHNGFVRFKELVALAAWEAGVTFVIENPVDRGMRQSAQFSWWWREHVPLWLMPAMRRLAGAVRAEWVSLPRCVFGSEFQKWTTLMAAGPRAVALRSLRGLTCAHASHARRARGLHTAGGSESARAGAYPVLFCATVAGLLSGGVPVSGHKAIEEVVASRAVVRWVAQVGGLNGASSVGMERRSPQGAVWWAADPGAMPSVAGMRERTSWRVGPMGSASKNCGTSPEGGRRRKERRSWRGRNFQSGGSIQSGRRSCCRGG